MVCSSTDFEVNHRGRQKNTGLSKSLKMAAVPITRQGMGSFLSCASFRCSSGRVRMFARPVSAAVARARFARPPFCYERAELSYTAPCSSRGGDGSSETGNCGFFNDAIALLERAPVLPELVVLDLDFTIWPFYCWMLDNGELFLPDLFSADMQLSAMLDFSSIGCCSFLPSPSEAVDGIYKIMLSVADQGVHLGRRALDLGVTPAVYPQAVDIIKALAVQKVDMAIASRTPSASVAKALLDKLSITQYFLSMEIYFTIHSKTKHFTALREKTSIPYSFMLCFDDESKNINAAAKLGVSSILVTEGLDLKSLEKGLNVYASKNS